MRTEDGAIGIAARIGDLLTDSHVTVAVAESLTGGALASRRRGDPQASRGLGAEWSPTRPT